MSAALNLFKKHPITIALLILYTWFASNIKRGNHHISDQIKHHLVKNTIGAGEFIGYSTIFLIMLGGIFLAVICGLALIKQTGIVFYTWLMAIIVVEIIAIIGIQ
jgi:hypothetical protein